jgi:hypothetical protein
MKRTDVKLLIEMLVSILVIGGIIYWAHKYEHKDKGPKDEKIENGVFE